MRIRTASVALLLGAAVALAGCDDAMNPIENVASQPVKTAVAVDDAANGSDEASTQPEVKDAPNQPEKESTTQADTKPAMDGSSREVPLPAGEEFGNENWRVTLSTTVQDASDVVLAENLFNDEPAEGRQFVMVEVNATYIGDDTGLPWTDLRFDFVGSQGNTFGSGSNDYCGVIPNDLTDLGEMHPGASGGGNVCVSVPAEQIEGGVWAVREFLGDPIYVALD